MSSTGEDRPAPTMKLCPQQFLGDCLPGCKGGWHVEQSSRDSVKAQSEERGTTAICVFHYAGKCRYAANACAGLHVPAHLLTETPAVAKKPASPKNAHLTVSTIYRPPRHVDRRHGAAARQPSCQGLWADSTDVPTRRMTCASRAVSCPKTGGQPPVLHDLSEIRGMVSDIYKIAEHWNGIQRCTGVPQETAALATQAGSEALTRVRELHRYLRQTLQKLGQSPAHGSSAC
jgi:hypothetical protein